MAKKYKHSKTRSARCKFAAELGAVNTGDEIIKSKPTLWRHLISIGFLAATCVAIYGWTLHFPMVFDDLLYLKNNPLAQDRASFGYFSDFPNFANWPAKNGFEPDLATNFILRPVAYATFYLNFLADGFNPMWWRVVNILIHVGNVALIYALIILLLSKAGGTSLKKSSISFIAFTTALFFAVHPMATESVTYIVQRFTALGTFFFLLTLVLYLRAVTVASRRWRWPLLGGAVLALVMGMQTKECTFTAPLIAVLLDGILLRTSWRSALKRALPLLLCMPIIPVLVLLVAWAQNGGVLSMDSALNITNSKDMPVDYWHYLFTQLTVIAEYLWLIVWPASLNLDPEWPLYRTLFAGPVLLALVLFAGFVAASGWLYHRCRADARVALLHVAMLWFFVTIIVSSGLVPLPDLMAEHRAYLPSIGIFALIACLLDLLRTSAVLPTLSRAMMPAGVMAIGCALAVTAWQRNQVWKDRVSLWEDTAAKSPGKFRVWNNLGVAYAEEKRMEDALRCFETAMKVEPQYMTAYTNRISVLNSLGRYQEALDASVHLIKTLEFARQFVDVQCNMGIALIGVGQVEKGKNFLEEIVSVAPMHRQSHLILGAIYQQQNKLDKALSHWEQAVSIAPADPQLASLIESTQVQMSLVGGE